jgi:hypothetical protein
MRKPQPTKPQNASLLIHVEGFTLKLPVQRTPVRNHGTESEKKENVFEIGLAESAWNYLILCIS